MKKIILTAAIAMTGLMALPAFANHPVARTTAVAASDHPAEMAVATGEGHHPVARTAVVASSDHPAEAAVVTQKH